MGLWSFVIVQSVILFVWITANPVGAMSLLRDGGRSGRVVCSR